LRRYKGGYADSAVKRKRWAICGYFASSREKFRRAREAEQFGNAVGYCALSDQYLSLCAIKMSRTSGLARMVFRLPSQEFAFCASRHRTRTQFFQQNSNFRELGDMRTQRMLPKCWFTKWI
jgi:hypothetical protein